MSPPCGASKKLETKKLYQVLVVIDDFADTPQLHKPHGALDTLFIRGRHMQISTWVSSQKLRLISAAVRVNMQFLCCWRLRNQHELDEELSALLPNRPPKSARPPKSLGAPGRLEAAGVSYGRVCLRLTSTIKRTQF